MNTMKRGLSAFLGAALATLGLTVGSAALADPTTPTSGVGDINTSATGSISLQKFEQPVTATGYAHAGTKLSAAQTGTLTPIQDVQFTVYKLTGVDLTTNGGWSTYQTITTAIASAPLKDSDITSTAVKVGGVDYPITQTKQASTAADGTVSFTGLPLGAYLVSETSSPTGVIAKAMPFITSVPTPTGNGGWLYDVWSYPKNAVASIKTTVDDSSVFTASDTFQWTITTKIPVLNEGASIASFEISDPLPSTLAFQSASLAVRNSSGTAVTLAETTDYTLTKPTAGSAGTVKVTFTQTGIAKLPADGTATLTVITKVKSAGQAANKATLTINDASMDSSATTSWGNLTVATIAKGSTTKLTGSTIDICKSNPTSGSACKAGDVVQTLTPTSSAAKTVLLKAGNYWLVETQVPVGYTGISTAIPVSVGTSTTTTNVENVEKTAIVLPLAGGKTLWALVGTGILVALGAGAAAVANSRKTHSA
jgi:fimbrial isopeptide formation D2 family protein